MLSQPNYAQNPSYQVVQAMGAGFPGDYIIGDVDIIDTNAGQYSEMNVKGQKPDKRHQKRADAPNGKALASDINTGAFSTYKSTAAPFKPRNIIDKNCRDTERCNSMAKFALTLPAKKAYQLKCEVRGFTSTTGAIWNVDTIGSVGIYALGLQEDMWLFAREFHQDRGGAQVTRLTFIPKGFLVLGDAPH
jgi:prophage tail gpP-like protein